MVEAEEQREKERKAAAAGKEHQAKQHQHAADKKEEKAIEAGLPATEAVEEPVVAETVAPLEAEAIGKSTCLHIVR